MRPTNTQSHTHIHTHSRTNAHTHAVTMILLKSFIDVCIACLSFWLVGYAFAFGAHGTTNGGWDSSLLSLAGSTPTVGACLPACLSACLLRAFDLAKQKAFTILGLLGVMSDKHPVTHSLWDPWAPAASRQHSVVHSPP